MTRAPPLLLLLLLLPTISLLPTTTAASDTSMGWMILGQSGSDNKPCKGSIDECFDTNNDHEFEIMSTRRILATTQYVSYGALQANKVPCSQKGASYYNCAPGASANPYTRGCSAITRCHR